MYVLKTFCYFFLQIQKLFDGNTLSVEKNTATIPKNESRIHLFNTLMLKLNVCFP